MSTSRIWGKVLDTAPTLAAHAREAGVIMFCGNVTQSKCLIGPVHVAQNICREVKMFLYHNFIPELCN